MRKFFLNNVEWLTDYFKDTKWLFDMLALFFIFQTFLYSVNFQTALDIGDTEITALKAVFWILIFIITFLLYMETDKHYHEEDTIARRSVFSKALASKLLIRIIIYILVTIDAVLLFRELRAVLFNLYFSYFWIGIIIVALFEIARVGLHSMKNLMRKVS